MNRENAASPDALYAHARFVRGLAAHLLGEEDGADDVVQQTWLRASRHPAPAGPGRRSWLGRIARNLVHDHRRDSGRRRRREEAASRPEAVAGPDELVAREQVVQEVVAAVLALPTPLRRIVFLRYYEERSYEEIAQQLEIPETTVASRLRRARAALKETLDARLGDSLPWTAVLAGMLQKAPVSAAASGAGSPLLAGLFAALLLGGVVTMVALLLWENDDDLPRQPEAMAGLTVISSRETPEEERSQTEPRDERRRAPLPMIPFEGEGRTEDETPQPPATATPTTRAGKAADVGNDADLIEASPDPVIGGAGSRGELRRETAWPISRGGVGRTGRSRASSPAYSGVAWRRRLDFRPTGCLVASRTALFAIGSRQRVVALSREDGSILWQADMKKLAGVSNQKRLDPLLVGDRLYVMGHRKKLVVLDVNDGRLLHEQPAYTKTLWGMAGDAGGVIFAFRRDALGVLNGDLALRTFEVDRRSDVHAWLPPALDEERIAAVSRSGRKLTLRARSDGRLIATAPLDRRARLGPVIHAGRVLQPLGGRGVLTWRITESGLSPAWERGADAGAPIIVGMAVDDEQVYLLRRRSLLALDLETGATRLDLWTGMTRSTTPPVVNGDHLVWVDQDAGLMVVDRRTGAPVATLPLKTRFEREPLVLDREVFLLATKGEVVAIR